MWRINWIEGLGKVIVQREICLSSQTCLCDLFKGGWWATNFCFLCVTPLLQLYWQQFCLQSLQHVNIGRSREGSPKLDCVLKPWLVFDTRDTEIHYILDFAKDTESVAPRNPLDITLRNSVRQEEKELFGGNRFVNNSEHHLHQKSISLSRSPGRPTDAFCWLTCSSALSL